MTITTSTFLPTSAADPQMRTPWLSAVFAAAGRVEAEDVASLERVVGIAGGQAFRGGRVRIDPDVARTAGLAAGAAVGRDDVLHRADREAGVFEIEIFTADAEPTAEFSGAAGIADQLEAREPRGKFALDDLDRRDHGIALVHCDTRGAVLAGASAGAAGDDLVLHIAL